MNLLQAKQLIRFFDIKSIMKTIEFATYANCEGRYQERILASTNVRTVTEFKHLVAQAFEELKEIRRDNSNCPLFIFVNGVKLDELDTAELLAAASENKGICCELSDHSKIEKFLNA